MPRNRNPKAPPLQVTSSLDPITAYASKVVSGDTIAGRYVRASYKRHLEDLKNGAKRGLRFDAEEAARAFRFFPAMFTVTAGAKAGQPFHLLEWMTFVVGSRSGGGNRPALFIGGDDISLPAGQVTQNELSFTVPNDTVLDLYLYTGRTIAFPLSPAGQSLAAEYWFSGTKLFINNLSISCRTRFIVIAFDGSDQSSGPNKVFKTLADGNIQLLKLGAGTVPRFSDIILGSRWPSLQILDDGYFNVAAQPNKQPPDSINAG